MVKNLFLAFFLDWNRMLPWKIYESLLSRRDSFVSKEILGKIFERTTRRFPIFPWNATNFNAGILGSCDLDCDCDSVTNFFLVLCLVWEEFCDNFSRIQEFISSNDCITKKHQISGKFKKIEADGNNIKLWNTNFFISMKRKKIREILHELIHFTNSIVATRLPSPPNTRPFVPFHSIPSFLSIFPRFTQSWEKIKKKKITKERAKTKASLSLLPSTFLKSESLFVSPPSWSSSKRPDRSVVSRAI